MAGGSGLYSMVMPSWCAGAHQNRYVSQRVELDLYCEIPVSASPDAESLPTRSH